MLKSNVQIKEVSKFPTFPLLAQSKGTNPVIILFSDENTGMVVATSHKSNTIGLYSTNWSYVETSGEWEILPSGTTITLEQY